MIRIDSKAEMYELYERGAFGNKLETWPNINTFVDGQVTKRVVMRYKGNAGGAWVEYDIEPDRVPDIVAVWVAQGAQKSLITLNESAPDTDLLIQGEVMRSPEHLSLRFSNAPLPMRIALRESPLHAAGVRAQLILSTFLDPSSWDDLQLLLDRFDGAVVEFSTWSRDVGVIPRRNTVFWEVRHY